MGDLITGLCSGTELAHVYDKRKNTTICEFVPQAFFNEEIAKKEYVSWKESKRPKGYKCYKKKPIDEQFEDKVWCILNKMGFDVMNVDRNCQLQRGSTNTHKQIDVVAKSDNLICIIECKKATNELTPGNFDKDLDQIGEIKKDSTSNVYKFFNENGSNEKISIGWIFATEDYLVSDDDMKRATLSKIKIIDNWDYYEKLIDALGEGAKYQFLADVFGGKKIDNLIPPVHAIKGSMGKRTYYQFSMTPNDLMKISYVAHIGKSDKEKLETYQRLVEKSRITKISKYIEEEGGVFPTSIVINLKSDDGVIRFDKKTVAGDNGQYGLLYIPNQFKSAYIIDGQHRLFSYCGLDKSKTEMLPVVAFDNLEPEEQAMLFIKINSEQKSIKSGLYEQISMNQQWNSEDYRERFSALPKKVLEKLNGTKTSVFYKKIKFEGDKQSGRTSMTFSELSKYVKKYSFFGTCPKRKNAQLLPAKLFFNDIEGSLQQGYIVINEYFNYFCSKSKRYFDDWELGMKGSASKNGMVIPLLGILNEILLFMNNNKIVTVNQSMNSFIGHIHTYQDVLIEYFENEDSAYEIKAGDEGTKSKRIEFAKVINKQYSDFMKIEIEKYDLLKRGNVTNDSTEMIKTIERRMMLIVKHIFQSKYGNRVEQWWGNGIPQSVKEKTEKTASSKNDYSQEFEKYLYLIDFSTIISNRYQLFNDLFDIYDQSNQSKYVRLQWITTLNDIRQKSMHGTRGPLSIEEEKTVEEIFNLFNVKTKDYIKDNNLE